MSIDRLVTREYRLACRRCHHTWEATYQVGTLHDVPVPGHRAAAGPSRQ